MPGRQKSAELPIIYAIPWTALNLAAGRATQQHVEIVEPGVSEPILINGDPEQLDLVFLNLLLNGIEAMPTGGTLTVSIEVEVGMPGICCILFLDTGAGIDEAVMDRLFERSSPTRNGA